VWWFTPAMPATKESINRRITVQTSSGINWVLTWEITDAKRASEMAQVVGTVPASNVQVPDFKPQYHQKNCLY
jgi:hypothetical protein